MGFSVERFKEKNINNDLICVVCHEVLQDPVQLSHCEHTFCRTCIQDWISRSPTCPTDRAAIDQHNNKIGPPNKLLLDLLKKLTLSCGHAQYGCKTFTPWSNIEEHERTCNFHPDVMVVCSGKCDLTFLRKDFINHDCALALQTRMTVLYEAIEEKNREIESLQEKDKLCMAKWSRMLADMKIAVNEFKQDVDDQ